MDVDTYRALEDAADAVRSFEESLEDERLKRDRVIWESSQQGYSLGEIAHVTELAKSTVALVVKMENLRRMPPG